MRKMILVNAIIPVLCILTSVLTIIKIKGERFLPITVRFWLFDYARYIIVAQLLVLIISFIIWQEKKGRFLAIAIFIIWMFIEFFIAGKSA